MRTPVAAVVAALAAAIVGAVILGEYELAGFRPLLAGALFGVAIGEVIATVAKPVVADIHLLVSAGLVTEAGLVWATWISTGHHLELAPATAWIGIGIGAGSAALWLKSAGRRGDRTPGGATPTPGG